jgi:general stress protein 26
MPNESRKNDSVEKLNDLIQGMKVAMLTTREPDGKLRARPMVVQQVEFDGDLWFFTSSSSPKVDEIRSEGQVNVSFANSSDQEYVSVSGTAHLVYDKAKAEELWSPLHKAWFPNGVDDPDLALLKVKVDQAEYWDSPSGKMVQLAGFVKALATGERFDEAGENRKIDLREVDDAP